MPTEGDGRRVSRHGRAQNHADGTVIQRRDASGAAASVRRLCAHVHKERQSDGGRGGDELQRRICPQAQTRDDCILVP